MSRRRPRKIGMFAMNTQQYEDAIERSGMVFRPQIHHPRMILAFVIHLVTKRGVFGPDEFRGGMGKFFPDDYQWAHYKKQLKLFDNHGVDMRHVNVFTGFFLSLCLFLRMLHGTDGAVRMLLAMIEAAMSTVEFEFDKSGEPVITYKITEDGTQERDGWDSEFALYDLWSSEVMQTCINQRELQSYLSYAATTGANEDIRKVADATMQFVFDVKRDGQEAGMSYGGVFDAVSKTTLLGQLADDAPHLFRLPHQPPQAVAVPYGNPTVFNLGAVKQWGEQHRAWLRSTLGGPARWPIEGQTVAQLKGTYAEQSFGFDRPLEGGGMAKHSGLDITAARGLAVYAIYPGRVVKVRKGWQSKERDNNTPGWEAGNHIVIDYSGPDVPGGARLRHGYYHLDSVADLKVGDEVLQGQTIGTVGTTGNSTAPHLHLETAWMVGHGLKPVLVKALDPALVLRDGAINTARSSGVQLAVGGTAPRPVLTLTAAALHGLAAGGHMVPATGMPLVDPAIMARAAAAGVAAGVAAAAPAAAAAAVDAAAPQGGVLDDVWSGVKTAGKVVFKHVLAPGSVGRQALTVALVGAGVPPGVSEASISALAAAHDELASKGSTSAGDLIKAMTGAIIAQGVPTGSAESVARQAAALGGYTVT